MAIFIGIMMMNPSFGGTFEQPKREWVKETEKSMLVVARNDTHSGKNPKIAGLRLWQRIKMLNQ